MKTILMTILVLALSGGAALAQIDPTPDGVGIYADLDGMVNEVEIEAGTPLEVYLLLTNPTGERFLGGWACGLVVPDNVSVWGWNISTPGALVISDPPDFAVGHPAFPYQTVNLLMTFIIVPLDSEPAQFYITRNGSLSEGPVPKYLDVPELPGADILDMEMHPFPDGGTLASFTVNPDPTATESMLWGGMKALFR